MKISIVRVLLTTAALFSLMACSPATTPTNETAAVGKVIFNTGIGPAVAPVSGTVATAPVVVLNDYYFEGWYDDQDHTVKTTFPVSVTTADKTLYAHWKAATSILVYALNDAQTGYAVTTNGHTGNTIDQIVIPDVHAGLPVTQIGLPSLGGVGYYNTITNLHVDIPANVTTLGPNAFYGLSMTELTIPATVTKVEDAALGNNAFVTIVFPDSITELPRFVLNGNNSLTSVTLPAHLTSIGEDAFQSCSALTSLTLPSTVTSIGDSAFYGTHMTTLTSLAVVPPTVDVTNGGMFGGGTLAANLVVPSGSEYAYGNAPGWNIFYP